jgi:hypothetical protein
MQSRFEFLAQGGDPLPEQISLAPLMGEALSRPEVGLNRAEPEAAEKLFAGIGGVGHGRATIVRIDPAERTGLRFVPSISKISTRFSQGVSVSRSDPLGIDSSER